MPKPQTPNANGPPEWSAAVPRKPEGYWPETLDWGARPTAHRLGSLPSASCCNVRTTRTVATSSFTCISFLARPNMPFNSSLHYQTRVLRHSVVWWGVCDAPRPSGPTPSMLAVRRHARGADLRRSQESDGRRFGATFCTGSRTLNRCSGCSQPDRGGRPQNMPSGAGVRDGPSSLRTGAPS